MASAFQGGGAIADEDTTKPGPETVAESSSSFATGSEYEEESMNAEGKDDSIGGGAEPVTETTGTTTVDLTTTISNDQGGTVGEKVPNTTLAAGTETCVCFACFAGDQVQPFSTTKKADSVRLVLFGVMGVLVLAIVAVNVATICVCCKTRGMSGEQNGKQRHSQL